MSARAGGPDGSPRVPRSGGQVWGVGRPQASCLHAEPAAHPDPARTLGREQAVPVWQAGGPGSPHTADAPLTFGNEGALGPQGPGPPTASAWCFSFPPSPRLGSRKTPACRGVWLPLPGLVPSAPLTSHRGPSDVHTWPFNGWGCMVHDTCVVAATNKHSPALETAQPGGQRPNRTYGRSCSCWRPWGASLGRWRSLVLGYKRACTACLHTRGVLFPRRVSFLV